MTQNTKFLEKIEPLPINTEIVRYMMGPSRQAHQRIRQARKINEDIPVTIVFNYDIHGYGDAIVAAWIAEGAKGSKKHIVFKAQKERKALLEMLGQEVVNCDVPTLTHVGEYVNSQYEVGNPPFVMARALVNGIPTMPLRPTVSIQEKAPIEAEIIICPQSASKNREYPWNKWLEVFDNLRSHGKDFRVCGQKNGFIEKVPESYTGYNFTTLVSIFSKSKLFVGVDSGPAHLAGTMDLPSIVLLGRTTEDVYTHCINTSCISTPRKVLHCSGCWGGYKYSTHCNLTCQALNMIPVDEVVNAILTHKPLVHAISDPYLRDMVNLSNGKFRNGVEVDRHKSLTVLLQDDYDSITCFGGLKTLSDWEDHGMVPVILDKYATKRGIDINFVGANQLTKDRLPSAVFDRQMSSELVYVDDDVSNEQIEYCKPTTIVFDDAEERRQQIQYFKSKGWITTFSGFQEILRWTGLN